MKIEAKRRYFELCLDNLTYLLKIREYEDAANYASQIAKYAWRNFTGYYSSWKLENELLKIAATIPKIVNYNRPANCKVLHVVSETYSNFGHTKLLYEWIKNDATKLHEIVSTRQKKNALLNIAKTYNQSQIIHHTLEDQATVLEKALALKMLSKGYQYIILHIHPDDVIPIIAYGDENFTTPVLYNNHADHTFWLGNSISDNLIEFRHHMIKEDIKRRQIKEYSYLPIIVSPDIPNSNPEKKDPKANVTLLSTGTEYKYTPYKDINFFEACYLLAEANNNITINIVGVSKDFKYAKQFRHPQINLLGLLTPVELKRYEDNCDIYLMGFPLGSGMATLQPALKGKCVKPMYRPYITTLLFAKDNDAFQYSSDLGNWITETSELIQSESRRNEIQKKQYDYLQKNFSISFWRDQLNEIYAKSDKMFHEVKRNAEDIFFTTENEIMLSETSSFYVNHFDFLSKMPMIMKFKWTLKYNPEIYLHRYTLINILKFIFS